jgi:hypothetical protein
VDEVPAAQLPLFALDQQHALAGEDEEVLLVRLPVVAAAGLSGCEHGDREPELGELHLAALEDAAVAEHLAREPGRVAHVDDEPALGRRGEPTACLLEPRLPHEWHSAGLTNTSL